MNKHFEYTIFLVLIFSILVSATLFSCKKKTNEPDYYIRVLTPNGDSSLMKCHTYKINWESNSSDRVRIDLYKNGSFFKEISTGTKNDGSYDWYIPNLPNYEGENCFKIKMYSVSNSSINSFSGKPLTITPDTTSYKEKVVVIYPNGGEIWTNNVSHKLIIEKNFTDNVDIYVYCGDYPEGSGLSDIPGDSISITCRYFTISDKYKFMVCKHSNHEIYDYSDDFFEICGGKSSTTNSKTTPQLFRKK